MSANYPKDVFAGKNDFLFHPWYTVFEQLCQASLPTDRVFTRWELLFETRRAWCKERNIRYVTLVIPERHVIYEDCLPDGLKISPNRASIRMKRVLERFAPESFLYPEAELRQARSNGDVFFKTDEHLNPYGNYICYKYLLDHLEDIGLKAHMPEDYSIETFQYTGNIGIPLDTEPSEDAEDWSFKDQALPVEINSVYKKYHKYLEIVRHQNKSLPKAVFFGDSNLDFLKNFLNPHFSKLVMVPYIHKMFYDLVSYEQPDLVVHVMSEHRLGMGFLNHEYKPPNIMYVDIEQSGFEDYADMSVAVCEKRVVAELDFSAAAQNHLYLLNGWGGLETDRRWMLDTVSRVALDLCSLPQAGRFIYIEIRQSPFLHGGMISQQRIKLSYRIGSSVFNLEEHIIHEAGIILWKLDVAALHDHPEGLLILTFEHPDGTAPSAVIEGNTDRRMLSFYVSRLTIYAD